MPEDGAADWADDLSAHTGLDTSAGESRPKVSTSTLEHEPAPRFLGRESHVGNAFDFNFDFGFDFTSSTLARTSTTNRL